MVEGDEGEFYIQHEYTDVQESPVIQVNGLTETEIPVLKLTEFIGIECFTDSFYTTG